MLAPNPHAEALVHQTEKSKVASRVVIEKFVFGALLVAAYTIAVAAIALPVLVWVW